MPITGCGTPVIDQVSHPSSRASFPAVYAWRSLGYCFARLRLVFRPIRGHRPGHGWGAENFGRHRPEALGHRDRAYVWPTPRPRFVAVLGLTVEPAAPSLTVPKRTRPRAPSAPGYGSSSGRIGGTARGTDQARMISAEPTPTRPACRDRRIYGRPPGPRVGGYPRQACSPIPPKGNDPMRPIGSGLDAGLRGLEGHDSGLA
jgi:hypothetical protein